MALTDRTIRAAKPTEKQYKLSDAGGLFLLVTPAGGKLFRFKYRFGGKEKMLAIGIYPDIGLAEARERHAEARKLLARGVDPSAEKKQKKIEGKEQAINSFKAVALEWFTKQRAGWTEKHAEKILARFENDIFNQLGGVPVSEVDAPRVLKVLRKIEDRQAFYFAGRVRQTIGQVMRYAVATGKTKYDPVPALRDALTVHVEKHMAAVTDPKRVGELLNKFDRFTGTHTVGTALQLAPLIFGRMGELRKMKWSDLKLDEGLWSIPSMSMKMRQPHLVPLSIQAVSLIKGMEPISGHLEYVFPSKRDPLRPMSENAINVAMRRLGIDTQAELTGHGFRAMARTILRERLGYDSEWIEAQLSHRKKGSLGSAYDRTIFLEQRVGMMQAWADYLDTLKKSA